MEDHTIALVTALGAAIVAIGTLGGTLFTLWAKSRKEIRADAISEYKDVLLRQDADLNKARQDAVILNSRVDELTTRMFKIQDDLATCRSRDVQTRAELSMAYLRIKALETATNTASVPTVLTGVIVSDLKGKIRVFSPALAAILHWLPQEMTGKFLDHLMPPETLVDFQEMMKAMIEASVMPDQSRVILTELIDKEGKRIPVAMTHDGWKSGEDGLITTEIRQRLISVSAGGDSGILKRSALT